MNVRQQPLNLMRRMFHPAAPGGGVGGAARILMVLWMVAGLVICVERTPDLVGHSHVYGPGHGLEILNQFAGDVPDQGSTSPSSGYHFHVVKDFTSIDTDVPALVTAGTGQVPPTGFRVVDERLPDPPVFETEGPPLI